MYCWFILKRRNVLKSILLVSKLFTMYRCATNAAMCDSVMVSTPIKKTHTRITVDVELVTLDTADA